MQRSFLLDTCDPSLGIFNQSCLDTDKDRTQFLADRFIPSFILYSECFTKNITAGQNFVKIWSRQCEFFFSFYRLSWYVIVPTGATPTAVPVQKTSSASITSFTWTAFSTTCEELIWILLFWCFDLKQLWFVLPDNLDHLRSPSHSS